MHACGVRGMGVRDIQRYGGSGYIKGGMNARLRGIGYAVWGLGLYRIEFMFPL